ncbi:MAG: hypothetical protein OEW67_10965 [Cyclobacteriaceae bacterium]|nr:hypothetical protein [Cyclobacteriaceae bacterium]
MISKSLKYNLVGLLDLREGDQEQQDTYIESFKNESIFVHFLNEFIPIELVNEQSKKELISVFGDSIINLSVDKQLSDFYKKHNLKRDINTIADSISYIIVEDDYSSINKIDDDFIDVKLVESLCKYQGRTYKAKDQTLKAIGQKLSENVLKTTNFWLDQIPFSCYHKEPERYWQVAGVFKQYTWGKLFFPQHQNKKVFLTVGINLKEMCLFYGLDCLRSGTSKLSTDQILMFDHYTKDKNTIVKIPLDKIGNTSWNTLVKDTTEFFKQLEPLYSEVVDYIWYNQVNLSSISHQLLRINPDIHFFTKKGGDSDKELQHLAISLVVDYERDSLEFSDKSNLASAIKTLENEEDTNVYDIHSFNNDGSDKYIKVISSNNSSISGFKLSESDVQRSIVDEDKSYIYGVFNLSMKQKSGNLIIKKGAFNKVFDLNPVVYTID